MPRSNHRLPVCPVDHFRRRSISLPFALAIVTISVPVAAIAQGLSPESPNQSSAESPKSSAPTSVAAEAAPAVQSSTSEPVSPGPIENERRQLLETINGAKQYGFGTTAYLNAYKDLDDRVRAGAPESEIRSRFGSIVTGLDEQLKRAKLLKTQRPTPPIAASSPPPSAMESGRSSGGLNLSGSNSDQLFNKLKDKWFGGEIPDSIKQKIPAGFDPSMLNGDTAKELMKKYGKQ